MPLKNPAPEVVQRIYDQLSEQYRSLITASSPDYAPAHPCSDERAEIERLNTAPFASDPATTLRPARLMVVSMKPYGAPGRSYPAGEEERAEKPGYHRWYDGNKANGNFVREADRLLRGILALLKSDADVREVFSTYAYFFRAADAKQLKRFGLERIDCSAYHRLFLAEIAPEVILCIGNGPAPSAFALYRELLRPAAVTERSPAPRVKMRAFRENGRLVIGVPHLSYVRAEQLLPSVREILGSGS